MNRFQSLQRIFIATACVGLLLPGRLFAAAPVAPVENQTTILDVALYDGGVFAGQVVDKDGTPLAAVPVSLKYDGHQVAHVQTDENGVFAVRGVKTGVYTVQAQDVVGIYRAWNGTTAPPAAKPGALLISHNEVVRGQCDCGAAVPGDCSCGDGCGYALGCGGVAGYLTNPLVIGAVVATAIAVPVALSNSGSSS